MRNLLLITLFVFISCKSSKVNVSNTNQDLIDVSDSSQGTIDFKGSIINVYNEPLTICGSRQENMVSLQLSEIIESRISLINKPQKAKTVFFKFLGNISNLKSGDIIHGNAKEYLCNNGIETFFVVTQYEKQ